MIIIIIAMQCLFKRMTFFCSVFYYPLCNLFYVLLHLQLQSCTAVHLSILVKYTETSCRFRIRYRIWVGQTPKFCVTRKEYNQFTTPEINLVVVWSKIVVWEYTWVNLTENYSALLLKYMYKCKTERWRERWNVCVKHFVPVEYYKVQPWKCRSDLYAY